MHTSPLLVALIHISEAFPLFPSSLLPSPGGPTFLTVWTLPLNGKVLLSSLQQLNDFLKDL